MKFIVFYLQLINSREDLGMFFSSAFLIRKLRKYTATLPLFKKRLSLVRSVPVFVIAEQRLKDLEVKKKLDFKKPSNKNHETGHTIQNSAYLYYALDVSLIASISSFSSVAQEIDYSTLSRIHLPSNTEGRESF